MIGNKEQFTDSSRLLSVNFEVDGQVQGVSFRPYALTAANERGLKGWVKNTRRGAIYGVLQGEKNKVEDMKKWLITVGPPRCVIQGCLFSNERELVHTEYSQFTIEPNDW